MDGVLVIFQKKPGVGNSMASVDSDLTVAETLHFLDVYKHWLLTTYIREV